ncbi:protein mono-ADP-ribosyltransferase TIPARP-like [Gracilinanus agilis]|nr:protein mono-ADP-ribosyltransferase TIPARP-like [Gracilinanus agilis]
MPLSPLPAAEAASSQVLCPSVVTSANFYPETWIAMDPSQDFIQVPVSKEDKSYRTIYNLFHKTVPEIKYRILKILRVQNQFLWEKYKRKKEYMSKKANDISRIMNERHLFHGTSQDVVDGICKHNFDPRVCGKHATMFGQGSYFARKASYSHSFSKRSPKGVHFMFLAKVLTGRYTVGNHNMRRPPPVNPDSITSDLYDSCVDNYFEPQIFVIFNDDQSYPYFVIQYEEVSNTVTI